MSPALSRVSILPDALVSEDCIHAQAGKNPYRRDELVQLMTLVGVKSTGEEYHRRASKRTEHKTS